MKSQKPIFSKLTTEGSAILYNATGDEIGTVKDPQDADEIVMLVNGDDDRFSHYRRAIEGLEQRLEERTDELVEAESKISNLEEKLDAIIEASK